MQTRNKFFRGFSASKVIVLIIVVALFVVTFFLPDKVGVSSAYLLTIFVCLEFLTVGATSIFYGIQMVKYGVGKDSKQPFLAIGVLSLVFGVGYISLTFLIRSSSFEAIRFVFRLAPLIFAASICFIVPLRIREYKEYKQKSNYLKSVDDNTYYDRFMNSNSLEEEQTIIKEAEEYVVRRNKEEYELLHSYDGELEYDGESKFDGNTLQFIGWRLLGGLVTIITLGILYPVAVNMINRWQVKHTVINGRRLSFDGTALQLLGKWILWWFLTLITIGIYGLFVPIKVKSWTVKHSTMMGGKEGVESKFSGKALPYVGMILLTGLIKLITLGLLTPVAQAMMIKWEVNHTTYNGYHVIFDGNGLQLTGKYILWTLLGIVTLGIFFLVIPIRMTKWTVKHSQLEAIVQETKK